MNTSFGAFILTQKTQNTTNLFLRLCNLKLPVALQRIFQ